MTVEDVTVDVVVGFAVDLSGVVVAYAVSLEVGWHVLPVPVPSVS